ncbi:MAG: hypothetical protein GKR94_07655 [Gammaproteobacteria bacterium]|nr:hypothetical protein [Gammaproteobacteria bacterium]
MLAKLPVIIIGEPCEKPSDQNTWERLLTGAVGLGNYPKSYALSVNIRRCNHG